MGIFCVADALRATWAIKCVHIGCITCWPLAVEHPVPLTATLLHELQVNALGTAGQWLRVLDFLKEMEADGNPPTDVAFKAAVDCCSKVSWHVGSGLVFCSTMMQATCSS